MTERITLLGWGSLLWEGGSEFDAWHGPWQNDGPLLSIEFSRVSSSRHGALTLVIDSANGVPTTVAHCVSRRSNIAEAIEDLRRREGASVQNIGFVRRSGEARFRDRQSRDTILSWAANRDMDGVVWTDPRATLRRSWTSPFPSPRLSRMCMRSNLRERRRRWSISAGRRPSCERRCATLSLTCAKEWPSASNGSPVRCRRDWRFNVQRSSERAIDGSTPTPITPALPSHCDKRAHSSTSTTGLSI